MCHSEGLIFSALNTNMRLLDSIQIAVLVWRKPVQYLRVLAWRSAGCKFTNDTMNSVIFPASPLVFVSGGAWGPCRTGGGG